MSFVRRIGLLRWYADPGKPPLADTLDPMALPSARGQVAARPRRRWLVQLLVFLPTLLAVLYYGFIASDQYESEAKFVVRSGDKPFPASGMEALLQLALGHSQDDSYAVQEYITSRAAIADLQQRLPLEGMYNVDGADFAARFPSIFFVQREERFHRYFNRMISVIYSRDSGVTTLQVRAFRPQDAQAIAQQLLGLGERLVNRMNERLNNDTVKTSLDQLEASHQRLVDAQLALTSFRSKELMIDPASNAATLTDLLGKLSTEVAQTRAKIAELTVTSPASLQITALRRHLASVNEQIGLERGKIGNGPHSLAERMAAYERLRLERDFAQNMLDKAEKDVVRARLEARRQHLYLERVVEPQQPDYATHPRRLADILTIVAGNLLLVLVGWLIFSGIREHASESR